MSPASPATICAPCWAGTNGVVDFEITPNRPDCLCMIGLAREAAVTFQKELKLHEPQVKASAGGDINDM